MRLRLPVPGLLALSFLLTVLLARLDNDATSFVDIARLENVPALIAYTLVFFVVLGGLQRLVVASFHRPKGAVRRRIGAGIPDRDRGDAKA